MGTTCPVRGYTWIAGACLFVALRLPEENTPWDGRGRFIAFAHLFVYSTVTADAINRSLRFKKEQIRLQDGGQLVFARLARHHDGEDRAMTAQYRRQNGLGHLALIRVKRLTEDTACKVRDGRQRIMKRRCEHFLHRLYKSVDKRSQ